MDDDDEIRGTATSELEELLSSHAVTESLGDSIVSFVHVSAHRHFERNRDTCFPNANDKMLAALLTTRDSTAVSRALLSYYVLMIKYHTSHLLHFVYRTDISQFSLHYLLDLHPMVPPSTWDINRTNCLRCLCWARLYLQSVCSEMGKQITRTIPVHTLGL